MDEQRVELTPPIKVACPAAGFETAQVLFKGEGWKYRHIRLWEEARGAAKLAEVISERVLSWNMPDGKGGQVPFKAGPGAMDDLHPALASWLVTAYREAYNRAGLPDPNV